VNVVFCLIAGFLIGGLPTGLICCRIIKGVDPRTVGSGSTGAANVSRVLGKKWAALVLVIDIFKGFLPTRFLPALISPDAIAAGTLATAAGLIIGHVWTPYAGFRGGKGVATAAGAMIAIDGFAVLIGGGVWLLFFLPFRIVSLASMLAACSLPFSMLLLGGRLLAYVIAAALVAAFIVFTHRRNIARLVKGEEKRL
jgi:acyl phosphate:glycerol-3-phosphate acyltransferase